MRELRRCPYRTGTSYGQLIVVLAIQIKQYLPGEHSGFDGAGAAHAIFLVRRKEALKRAMHNAAVLKYAQSHRDADAVVGAKRSAGSGDPGWIGGIDAWLMGSLVKSWPRELAA